MNRTISPRTGIQRPPASGRSDEAVPERIISSSAGLWSESMPQSKYIATLSSAPIGQSQITAIQLPFDVLLIDLVVHVLVSIVIVSILLSLLLR